MRDLSVFKRWEAAAKPKRLLASREEVLAYKRYLIAQAQSAGRDFEMPLRVVSMFGCVLLRPDGEPWIWEEC